MQEHIKPSVWNFSKNSFILRPKGCFQMKLETVDVCFDKASKRQLSNNLITKSYNYSLKLVDLRRFFCDQGGNFSQND